MIDALQRIERQIELIDGLPKDDHESEQLRLWDLNTQTLLEKIFGKDSDQARSFSYIDYSAKVVNWDSIHIDNSKLVNALDKARTLLTSFHTEIKEYGLESNEIKHEPIDSLKKIFEGFHTVVKQLRVRHGQRETLDVKDEYDVQDLLHALLKAQFRDVRPEEWAPSYANGSSRMDFLLKNEQIIIEVKMTRDSMKDRDLVDQLIVDRERYSTHPDCKTIVCFVYDPLGRISNPDSIRTDMGDTESEIPVFIEIRPIVT